MSISQERRQNFGSGEEKHEFLSSPGLQWRSQNLGMYSSKTFEKFRKINKNN